MKATDAENDFHHQAALEVEDDEALSAEMAEWDFTVGDGLPSPDLTGVPFPIRRA